MEDTAPKDLLHGDLDIEMSEKLESVTSFDDIGLKEDLLKGKHLNHTNHYRSVCLRI